MSYLSRIIYNIPYPGVNLDRKFSTKNVEKNPQSALCFISIVENQTAEEGALNRFSTSSPRRVFHTNVEKWKDRIKRAVWRKRGMWKNYEFKKKSLRFFFC